LDKEVLKSQRKKTSTRAEDLEHGCIQLWMSIPARADGRSQQEPTVDHNNLMDDDTPKTIVKAFVSPDADDWKEAIRSEMDSILFNGI
jgi:hypothetical protein